MPHSTLEEISQWIDDFLWPDQDERQRVKRERILEAATDLFVRLGYRKTSMDDVARQAGIAKGTVYLYYRNKAELVFHAIALEERAYLQNLAPILDPSSTPADRLRSLIEVWLTLSQEMPLLARFTSGDSDVARAIREVDTSVLTRINDWETGLIMGLLEDAGEGGWPPAVLAQRAEVLLDVMYALTAAGRLTVSDMSVPDYAASVAGILVDGVLDRPSERLPQPASGRAPDQPRISQGALS
jgi:AcrR family transcriptional regulator